MFDYEKHTKEVKRIEALIREQGSGAGPRWAAIATSASAGNQRAIKAITELIGHEPESMADIYAVQTAANNAMTGGEQAMEAGMAAAAYNAMANPEPIANPYLNNRLGDLRRAKGMSQAQLAKVSGINLVTIQKLENGTNRLLGARSETVLRLARGLGVTMEEILGE